MNSLLKSLIGAGCLLFCASFMHAQQENDPGTEDVTLDLLRAPLSPAANLLGISSSQIEKPSDPAAFMASVQTASGNFTALPTSYAVDLAPAWLLAGSKIRIDDFMSSAAGKSISQSFILSVATNTVSAEADTLPDVTKLSAGIKFSVLRGYISEETREHLSELASILGELTTGFDRALDSLKRQDKKYLHLDSLNKSILSSRDLSFQEKEVMTRSIRAGMVHREDSLADFLRAYLADDFSRAKLAAESLQIIRYGWKLDLAAGMVWDFPGLNFDRAGSNSIAAWASGGYEDPAGLSLLAIARYLHFLDAPTPGEGQDIAYQDYSALDGGLRLIYSNQASRFATSIEGLFRSSLGNPDIDPAWRFTVNAEYEVGKNKKLTLILGRDFDGTLTGDGNLIVALNFLIGFGTNKKL